MFSGIVELQGKLVSRTIEKNNLQCWIEAPEWTDLYIDQSIAHNGICLTIDSLQANQYRITAIDETIQKTTISEWKIGDQINLERCIQLSQRLDGHIVQGHVEAIGECTKVVEKSGSVDFTFNYPIKHAPFIVEKGSICIDGISLTAHSLNQNNFVVSIIPYTMQNTNASQWKVHSRVNLEFDIIGKYILRQEECKNLFC